MKLKVLMFEDLIYSNYKDYGQFEKELDCKYYEEVVKTIEDLMTAGRDIVNDYKQAEKEGVSLHNKVEVRTQLLKDNLIVDELTEEDLKDASVIYQDVNLEPIAETLQEVTIEDLEAQLGYYGTWQVHSLNEVCYLIDFA